MLNPGTYPDQRYMSIGDIVMVYENTYASYVKLRVPGWVRNYPAAKFAHAIYATSSSQLADAIGLSRQRNAGYIYVTGNSGANPYRSLPAYWAGRECDHRQMRPRRRRRRQARTGAGADLPAGMALPGEGRREQRPVDAARDVGRAELAEIRGGALPQSSVYSASSTSFPARTYGGVTIPHVW